MVPPDGFTVGITPAGAREVQHSPFWRKDFDAFDERGGAVGSSRFAHPTAFAIEFRWDTSARRGTGSHDAMRRCTPGE
jgi:hypothetical protein